MVELMSKRIARCRLIFAVVVVVAVLFDPMQPTLNPWVAVLGAGARMDPDLLGTVVVYLVYSILIYAMVWRWPARGTQIGDATIWTDVLFAAAIALAAESKIRLFYPFFTFAILEAGLRGGLRRTMAVALSSVLLWLVVVAVVTPDTLVPYLMRPVYLLVVGYLVGYLGEQRLRLASEIHLRRVAEQRADIARELHDGYLQVLSAANLQLESCRQQLRTGQHQGVAGELSELQQAINAEHDQLRLYLRTLAEADPPGRGGESAIDTRISLQVDAQGSSALLEHVLRILSESVANVRRHAAARTATIRVENSGSALTIAIDDDGRGFAADQAPPWSIASRVRQLGGALEVLRDAGPGAHLQISLPAGSVQA